MKKLLLLLITITSVSCNQTNVTIVEFEDEKSNAIRGHFQHYLNNDIDGLKKLWADDDKITLWLGSVETSPLSRPFFMYLAYWAWKFFFIKLMMI